MNQVIDINAIRKLHDTYEKCMGLQFPMYHHHERMWWESAQIGLNDELLAMVIKDRQKRVAAGVRKKECLYVHNLVGDEGKIAELMNEAAMLMALRRKIIDPARASVLQSTGRAADHGEPAKEPVLCGKALGKALDGLKQAIGE